jgi:hypothetical protein
MLMKESDGFIVLPGGFGTLDEAFELLTLLQTGKAEPAPMVLLDVPEDSYWKAWDGFTRKEVATRGLISEEDLALYRVTNSPEAAAAEILGFYRNYHSCRWVGETLVLRMRQLPPPEQLAQIQASFADLVSSGSIAPVKPLPAEVRGSDHVDLARLALRFNGRSLGRLRLLIDALNEIDEPATRTGATPPPSPLSGGPG